MKKSIIIALILAIGLFISYNSGYKKALRTNENFKKEIVNQTLDNNPIPQCDMGNCPIFYSFDADGDGWSNQETVILERFGMSQFAGRVMVVDEGKTVFISKGQMRVTVQPRRSFDYNNGFIISYSSEANSTTDIVHDIYEFKDGEYRIIKTLDQNTPMVTYHAKLKNKNIFTTDFYKYDLETKQVKIDKGENLWFYASPNFTFGDQGSDEWKNLINKNQNSIFKITGVQLDECEYDNSEKCVENIVVEDIEVVK